MKKFNWKSIEFFLLSMFIIRLYGIWFPPLETWHSWRQTLTNMIARNMNEHGFTWLYPTIDMAGNKTGIIGSEFPLFQQLIAGMNGLFGYEHWYGRLIALITSTIASWCFYKTIELIWNKRTAWFSTVIFVCSLWFSFSRKTMPDTFAVSLVLIGIYGFAQYIVNRKATFLLLGFIGITLGGLSKIPAVYLFILVIPFFLNRRIAFSTRITVSAAVGLASLLIGGWYFIWVPHLVETYGFQLYFPKGIREGLEEIKPLWGDFWQQFYFGALRSYIALFPVLLGILWLFNRHNRRYASYFILSFLVFLLFAIKTGTVFPTHNYYVLPFVPVLAVLGGLGLQRLDNRAAIPLIILIGIEGIGNQFSDFRVKDVVKYRVHLEENLDKLLPRKEKIVLAMGPNPEWMYWFHRKGWSVEPASLQDRTATQQLIHEGAHYLVIDTLADQTVYPYMVFKSGNGLVVYDLRVRK